MLEDLGFITSMLKERGRPPIGLFTDIVAFPYQHFGCHGKRLIVTCDCNQLVTREMIDNSYKAANMNRFVSWCTFLNH